MGSSFMLVLALRWFDPPSSAVIVLWEMENDRKANHRWRPLVEISPQLQIAVIAAEDQKFADHFGFDFESIEKSLQENRARPRGASTISQQTAKNLFLWQGRSYVRKGIEAWFTLLMELLWPKQRILEIYLNIAEFGPGVYGAQAAAQTFFATSARNLTAWQSGLLTAVLPNPRRMSAANPSAYVQSRALEINQLVRQMGGAGHLTKIDASAK